MGFVPRISTYRIGATFEIGMYEYDSGYIYMPWLWHKSTSAPATV